MACRKTPEMIAFVIFVITCVMFASGSIMLGVIRHIFNIADDTNISRDHLILAGNALQVLSLGGIIYILSVAGQTDVVSVGLVLTTLFLFVIIAYLTNYDPSDSTSQWVALICLIIDVYIKLTAILVGFGAASIDEVTAIAPRAISQLMGGR